jgi:glycosyltransferase involved in cell wall biosynthesis
MLHYISPAWNNGWQHYASKPYRNVVVFGTYNRAHLMKQSMYAYQESLTPMDAVVVLDDGSTDNTLEVCDLYAHSLDVFYFKLEDKAPGEWRDSAAFLNMGISFAIHALNAQRVIPTHPEIVPGIYTFDAINAAPEGIDFVMFRGYYLPVELQLRYEDWFTFLIDDRSKGGTGYMSRLV